MKKELLQDFIKFLNNTFDGVDSSIDTLNYFLFVVDNKKETELIMRLHESLLEAYRLIKNYLKEQENEH